MYGRSRVNLKVEPRSTFTFTRGLSYIASSSFTRVNFRCVRTEKLRDSGNQLSGCVHTIRDSFWCSIYQHLAIVFRRSLLIGYLQTITCLRIIVHRTNTIQLRLFIVVPLESKSWIVLIHVLIPLSYLLFVCTPVLYIYKIVLFQSRGQYLPT